MRFEPAIYAYRKTRTKGHGAGPGGRLLGIKMALCAFSISNGCFPWYARLAAWAALYATPRLPDASRPGRLSRKPTIL